MELLDDDLYELIRVYAPAGSVIETLSNGKPNFIVDVTRDGISIETERSRAAGTGTQLVPAWMIQIAWDWLQERRRLTNKELLASEGLNVKRSSAVCAILARFPRVEVESVRPIVLRMKE